MGERETALDIARRQLQRIDAKIADLGRERESILSYIQTTQKQLADNEDAVVPAAEIPMPQPLSDRPGSLARQLNRQIVRLSMEIMRDRGEPMAAPEIHAVHPLRERFTPEALYRLLYNRVVSRKLNTISGSFWPIEESLPIGWERERPTTKHAHMS